MAFISLLPLLETKLQEVKVITKTETRFEVPEILKPRDPSLIVSKKTGFDAAHFLPFYKGKCANTHGHHWEVEIGVTGSINLDDGMVIDFTELKGFLQWIEDKFDHKLINDIIANPTAENILLFIKEEAQIRVNTPGSCGGFSRWVKLEFIKVWETKDSCVEWRV